MIFFVGTTNRDSVSDRHYTDRDILRQTFGEEFLNDMEKYSTRCWKKYEYQQVKQGPSGCNLNIYCEIKTPKFATWFKLKYPYVQEQKEVEFK